MPRASEASSRRAAHPPARAPPPTRPTATRACGRSRRDPVRRRTRMTRDAGPRGPRPARPSAERSSAPWNSAPRMVVAVNPVPAYSDFDTTKLGRTVVMSTVGGSDRDRGSGRCDAFARPDRQRPDLDTGRGHRRSGRHAPDRTPRRPDGWRTHRGGDPGLGSRCELPARRWLPALPAGRRRRRTGHRDARRRRALHPRAAHGIGPTSTFRLEPVGLDRVSRRRRHLGADRGQPAPGVERRGPNARRLARSVPVRACPAGTSGSVERPGRHCHSRSTRPTSAGSAHGPRPAAGPRSASTASWSTRSTSPPRRPLPAAPGPCPRRRRRPARPDHPRRR